jgi:hypothetical protein
MRFEIRPLGTLLFGSLALAAMAGACGDSAQIVQTGSTSTGQGGSTASAQGGSGGGGTGGSTGAFMTGSGGAGTGGASQGFDVQPAAMQTITVALGAQTPTLDYHATLNGAPVNAGWAIDRGDIGVVPPGPAPSVTFTPKGTTGGPAKITAGLNNQTVSRDIFVKIQGSQNGADPQNPLEAPQIATTVASLTAGGGIGGVGGEGLGVAVSDPALVTALGAPVGDGSAQGLKWLYPYDKTVWPRGLLAPNLMWDWSIGDADAIQIELTTQSGSFSYKGTFGRPAILAQTNGKFVRHPIPQDVWNAATNSAGGTDTLTLRLTVAKNGMAYGPISRTWTVAPARLSGIIYYNSYGTQLAQNLGGAVGGNHMFGGAVLSIHGGDTGPKLTAGASGGVSACRVCHSVAANGSRLVVQHGDAYTTSSSYDLTPMSSTENAMGVGAEFPAVFPDGTAALAPNATILPLPSAAAATPTTGLQTITTDLGTPSFAPNGLLVAFNPFAGPVANPLQKLYVATFDPAMNAFSNPLLVVDDTGQPSAVRPGWPAFTPDEKFVVFHHQTTVGGDGNSKGALWTRKGAKAEIAWASATGPAGATRLDELNGYEAGVSYLPKLATPISMSCTGDAQQVGNIDPDHGDDVHLNYEPTVNPVASGGYVWVVFTSRRMYGSVATIPPFCSDPRGVDLVQNITTKKLWVAAVDLNAMPGSDASHPAFYLPAQEILAGNSRAFWALDPCKSDGSSCNAGDECCNGYCEPDMNGQLVCQNTPPNGMCSQPSEKCTTAADCCDMTNLCVNGFCTLKGPA